MKILKIIIYLAAFILLPTGICYAENTAHFDGVDGVFIGSQYQQDTTLGLTLSKGQLAVDKLLEIPKGATFQIDPGAVVVSTWAVTLNVTGASGIGVTYGITAGSVTTSGNITDAGNISVTGTSTLTGAVTFGAMPIWSMSAIDVTVTSSTVAGQMARTSAYVVYIATGAGTVSCWSKIGAQ